MWLIISLLLVLCKTDLHHNDAVNCTDAYGYLGRMCIPSQTLNMPIIINATAVKIIRVIAPNIALNIINRPNIIVMIPPIINGHDLPRKCE